MFLLKHFQQYISTHQLFTKQQNLLLAVSGGVDSVVLTDLCYKSGFHFGMAHCNFGLRNEESERDEVFVNQLARQYGVPLFLKHFKTKEFAEDKGISIQVAARELRYNWFYEILSQKDNKDVGLISDQSKRNPFSVIITAHHLDDNIETVLMNFFKGTGTAGLRGIKPKNGKIIRPLLFASKDEITEYAISNQLKWVEDSSNEENKYTRNMFRNELIPFVEKVFPAFKSNMASNIARFQEVDVLYNQAIEFHKKKLIEKKNDEVHIPILKLKKAHPLASIIYEIIKEYGFEQAQVGECIKLLESDSGRYILSSSHRILRNRAWLIISPLLAQEQAIHILENINSSVQLQGKKLIFEKIKKDSVEFSSDRNIALIDGTEITFPLILRKWKPGDYFYPLGMKKKKKLSRFFIDTKLSLLEKENTWVLECNKRIVWIVGQRIDDRFKITNSTKDVIRISWSNL